MGLLVTLLIRRHIGVRRVLRIWIALDAGAGGEVGTLDLLDTSSLRAMSAGERSAMKTSASVCNVRTCERNGAW